MDKRPERMPAPSRDTLRHLIREALENGPLDAKEISGLVGIPEKEVPAHLEHLRATLHRGGGRLVVRPAECAKCGFVFAKRERLTKPGKCPVCRGESIHAPVFSVIVIGRAADTEE
jgi:predicted Zn-ribbon and HTH transcriptional regulator